MHFAYITYIHFLKISLSINQLTSCDDINLDIFHLQRLFAIQILQIHKLFALQLSMQTLLARHCLRAIHEHTATDSFYEKPVHINIGK